MPNVVRRTDTNTAGGAVIGPCAATVFAEGLNVSLPGDAVTPHPCCGLPGCGAHCNAKTQGGSPTVFAEGKPIIHHNDIDTCGHKRNTHAPTVFIQG